ncbi:MAG: hypothetical protein H6658_07655 [Ardenticatenaceae bacterium]|nr:hypothetical protein [Ardenticatenaceae bacterium]
MNNLYFGCLEHKKYVGAGYRWAYWMLEDKGVVKRDEDVNIDSVLEAVEYWNPPEDGNNPQLQSEILPTVRQFLIDHKGDNVKFFDENFLFERWELGHEWREMKAK